MKFKSLFLTMLGAAVLVGCNNEISDSFTNGEIDREGGESTTATFRFNARQGTYAGTDTIVGVGAENAIGDAALFIYKKDGTPEAMAYVTNASADRQVTVKCKSGDKKIYLAVNIGGNTLLKAAGLGTGNSTTPDFLGVEWDENTSPFFDKVNSNPSPSPALEQLNAPIWSMTGTTIGLQTANTAFTPTGTSANNLIYALTANGNTTTGGTLVQSGNTTSGTLYLMSNWDSDETDTNGAKDYLATTSFKLEPMISATDSRTTTPDATNANKKNALLINVQRALAKVAVNAIATTVLEAAGNKTVTNASNAGKFVMAASPRWAAGNINMSEYPFQEYDGRAITSTRYNDTAALVNTVDPYPTGGWALKLDNSRFAGSSAAYVTGGLTTTAVLTTINTGANNANFSNATTKNYVYITENNNGNTLNHYSSFVVFGGQYHPAKYVTTVDIVGNITYVQTTGDPTTIEPSWTTADGKDTLYYVRSVSGDGLFFWGMKALQEYVCYNLKENTGSSPLVATTDTRTAAYINNLRATSANVYADLQTYYHGQCFYRVWISDDAITSPVANKKLARRNHIYDISITGINGPGIGDPNQIIDPHPGEPEPLEEADTYVTATINVMPWHLILQTTEIDLK